MIFIGYPPNSKAYCFWSQDHRRVYESTTAIFDERIFPYCSKENQDGPQPPIPENIEPHINPSFNKQPSIRKLEPSGHVFVPQPLLPLPQSQVLPQQPNQQIPPGPADRRDPGSLPSSSTDSSSHEQPHDTSRIRPYNPDEESYSWYPPDVFSPSRHESLPRRTPSPLSLFWDSPTSSPSREQSIDQPPSYRTELSPPNPAVRRDKPDTSHRSSLSDRHQHKQFMVSHNPERLLLERDETDDPPTKRT